MTCGVYLIECQPTGKRYVGSSVNMQKRWRSHRSDLRRGIHTNQHLQRAWSKYGEENFTFSELERTAVDEQISRELYWCGKLGPEFNIKKPDQEHRTWIITDETRAKQAAAKRGKPLPESARTKLRERPGRRQSPETIEKLRRIKANVSAETRLRLAAASTGKRHSEETKKKLRDVQQKRDPSINAKIAKTLTGRRASTETKNKMSAMRRGKKLPPRSAEYRKRMSKITRANYAARKHGSQLTLFKLDKE